MRSFVKRKKDDSNIKRLIKSLDQLSEKNKVKIINNTIDIINNYKNDFELNNYKKKLVNFDIAICISSYDRYDKLCRIIDGIISQQTKYTYKIFIMNDGSTDERYKNIKELYPDIEYIENEKNGGKFMYWDTITKLWSLVKKYETHTLCQIDDDFIICDDFINLLLDTFFVQKQKNNKYIAFHYHIYEFETNNFTNHKNIDHFWYDENNQSIDGGVLYDIDFIKSFDFTIDRQYPKSQLDSSRVWIFVSNKIREYNGKVYRFKYSLAFHDGNLDSKLNPEIRKNKKMITKYFKNNL